MLVIQLKKKKTTNKRNVDATKDLNNNFKNNNGHIPASNEKKQQNCKTSPMPGNNMCVDECEEFCVGGDNFNDIEDSHMNVTFSERLQCPFRLKCHYFST